MKKYILLTLFCFQLLHADQKLLPEVSIEKNTRERLSLENDVFALALCRVDNYFIGQERGGHHLRESLFQLKKELNRLVHEKYIKQLSPLPFSDEEYVCNQYKSFLLSSCLTYYLLRYISKFYSEEHAKEEGVISLFTDPCLADFFDELIGDLNFTEYEDQGWQFLSMYDQKVQAYAHYMQHPEPYSFSIFARGFLHYLVNHSYSRLYIKTKRLFGLIYSKKSVQKFSEEEKNLFEQIYKEKERSSDFDNNNEVELHEEKTREWELFERKTFAIALWRVRSYLASQKRGSMALKMSLLALAEDLDLLVMREYVLEKKHQGVALGPQYTCEQYRQFLKAACLTYFFLKYISKFYDEEAFLDDFDRYIETPFFSNFFNDLIEDLDFEEYLMQDFDFFLDVSNTSLNIKSPERLGFLVLSSLCLQHALENDNSKLFKKMDKLLGFLFGHALYKGAFYSKVLLDQFEIEKNKTGEEEERCLSSKILIKALL